MGWLSSFVNSISNDIGNFGTDISHGRFGKALGNPIASAISPMALPFGIANALKPGAPPAPPGTNPDLTNLQHQQQQFATQFRQNMPYMQTSLQSNANQQIGQQMNQGIQSQRAYNASRGMNYGGVNAGQEAGIRNQAAGQAAQMGTNIYSGLLNQAQANDNAAIGTGIGIQQQQQQIQNQVYNNAMSQLNSQNALYSGLADAGMLAAFA